MLQSVNVGSKTRLEPLIVDETGLAKSACDHFHHFFLRLVGKSEGRWRRLQSPSCIRRLPSSIGEHSNYDKAGVVRVVRWNRISSIRM